LHLVCTYFSLCNYTIDLTLLKLLIRQYSNIYLTIGSHLRVVNRTKSSLLLIAKSVAMSLVFELLSLVKE
jgi:hypothetical protein